MQRLERKKAGGGGGRNRMCQEENVKGEADVLKMLSVFSCHCQLRALCRRQFALSRLRTIVLSRIVCYYDLHLSIFIFFFPSAILSNFFFVSLTPFPFISIFIHPISMFLNFLVALLSLSTSSVDFVFPPFISFVFNHLLTFLSLPLSFFISLQQSGR